MSRKFFKKSFATLAVACSVLMASEAAALRGGVFNECNGIDWHSSPPGAQGYGKTCIHCNTGEEIRMWSEYEHNSSGQYTGRMSYYDLNSNYICTGSSTECAIRYYCGN